MNYEQQIKNLLAEAKEGLRYEDMSREMKVITKIAMLPIYAITCILIASYYVLLFLYNAFLAPTAYLEEWLDKRQENVQHATQAVLYFVCIPFIFFCRVIISFMSLYFYFLWFEIMVFTYLSTLGGIIWQPSINTATFDDEHTFVLKPGETGTRVFSILAFGSCAIYVFTLLLMYVGEIWDVYDFCNFIGWVYLAIITIVNPILFKKTEVIEEEVAASEEETAESESETKSAL